MGNAGAIIATSDDSAAEKAETMKSYGLTVASSASDLSITVAAAFLEVRKEWGLTLLQRMFQDFRLFRLIVDEAEKTLLRLIWTSPGNMQRWLATSRSGTLYLT